MTTATLVKHLNDNIYRVERNKDGGNKIEMVIMWNGMETALTALKE